MKNLELTLKELYAHLNTYSDTEEWKEISDALDNLREAFELVEKLKKAEEEK